METNKGLLSNILRLWSQSVSQTFSDACYDDQTKKSSRKGLVHHRSDLKRALLSSNVM